MEMKRSVAIAGERSVDGAMGFSLSIGIGLVLFIGGLVVAILFSDDNSVGLLFGIPMIVAGVVLPLFMMREHFTSNDAEATCPACEKTIKASNHKLQLDCPSCGRTLTNERGQIHLTE